MNRVAQGKSEKEEKMKGGNGEQASTFFSASCEQNFMKASFLRKYPFTVYSASPFQAAPPQLYPMKNYKEIKGNFEIKSILIQ